jgi:hypothetical protein
LRATSRRPSLRAFVAVSIAGEEDAGRSWEILGGSADGPANATTTLWSKNNANTLGDDRVIMGYSPPGKYSLLLVRQAKRFTG